MRVIKKFIIFATILMVYLLAVSILLKQFYMYQRGYYVLGGLISHSSIEVFVEDWPQMEE